MFSLIFQASEKTSGDLAYELGFFIGSHITEVLVIFLIIAALIIYWAVFRKKNLDW